jgi:hypothetical protein
VSDTPSSIQLSQSGDSPLSTNSCDGPNVREIHIDFLLEEEFRVNPNFLNQFIEDAGKHVDGPFSVESVKRSRADSFGEADLIVVYRRSEGNDQGTAILIEDKIRAEFQPDQSERYRKRGEQGKGRQWCDYWTCLVASEKYVQGGVDKRFDTTITLEKIKKWIAASEPERHAFKVEVIEEAIQKVGWLGPQQVDEPVTRFRALYFKCFEEFFADRIHDVNMTVPGRSWEGETWFRIKSSLLQKGAYIYHKAPHACVDLTFPNTRSDLLNAALPFLEDGMTIEQTGQSAAIRLKVSPITDFANFEQERFNVEQCIRICKEAAELLRPRRGALAPDPNQCGIGYRQVNRQRTG